MAANSKSTREIATLGKRLANHIFKRDPSATARFVLKLLQILFLRFQNQFLYDLISAVDQSYFVFAKKKKNIVQAFENHSSLTHPIYFFRQQILLVFVDGVLDGSPSAIVYFCAVRRLLLLLLLLVCKNDRLAHPIVI